MPPKRQRTAVINPGPLTQEQVDKFFSNGTQYAEFMSNYLNKEVQKPRFLDIEWLRKNNFQFLEYLDFAELTDFLSQSEDIYPELVKVFYCNLRLVDGVMISEVCRKPIRLTDESFGRVVGLPSEGTYATAEGPAAEPLANEFARIEAIKDVLTDSRDASAKEITAGQMLVQSRLLHYVIGRLLFPRRHNFSQLLRMDVVILWLLEKKKKVNWAGLVMQHMYDNRGSAALPYGHLVTRIIRHVRVNLTGEDKLSYKSFHAMMNEGTINQMGIILYGGDWVYKPKSLKMYDTRPPRTDGASSSSQAPPASASPEIMALLESILAEVRVNTTEIRANSTAIREISLEIKSLERRVTAAEANPIRAAPQNQDASDSSSMDGNDDDGNDDGGDGDGGDNEEDEYYV